MKRIFFLSITLSVLLISCESIPEAQFYTNTVKPEVGQEVFFTNDSHNAKSFDWDFGDGFRSNEENPVHIFSGTGSFEVILNITSKSGDEDKASLIIDVLIPTLLEIEVREYTDEYTVADASVYLYSSITDWDNQNNIIAEGFTDKDGIVVFSGLEPYGYYVDVNEIDHNNYDLRDYDYMTYIRTPDVLPNKINRFIAWVDYVGNAKGLVSGTRRLVIKKIDRNQAIKRQPGLDQGTYGWEELYNRRVNKPAR